MPSRSAKKKPENIFLRMHPLHRILISLLLSVVTFFLVRKTSLNVFMVFMIIWNVFAFTFILTSWIVFFTRQVSRIREFARKEDGSRALVFVLIVASSFASMFNVLLLMISKEESGTTELLHLSVAIAGMLLSWIMVHTTFAFHYAHMFYGDDEGTPEKNAEGLDFPEEKNPDYMDFAYFSFVIGMTFQVSDVEITSRQIRRLVLVHGLLSFGLNTFVVALTINIIAGLNK